MTNLLRQTIAWGFLMLVILACLVGPLALPYAFDAQDLALGPVAPCWEHWMGTDALGRDLLVRVLYGGRISLFVGLLGTAVALCIGVCYGCLSGILGGAADALLMRLVDILYALPFTLFVLLLMVVFGRNLVLLFIAIGAVEWMSMARVVRGHILALKEQAFIEAAYTMGQSRKNIVLKHFLPNVAPSIIVWGTLTVPHIMLLEAFVSFIGLGVQPPKTSWGLLIHDGANNLAQSPWLLIFPSLIFTASLFCITVLGDHFKGRYSLELP